MHANTYYLNFMMVPRPMEFSEPNSNYSKVQLKRIKNVNIALYEFPEVSTFFFFFFFFFFLIPNFFPYFCMYNVK